MASSTTKSRDRRRLENEDNQSNFVFPKSPKAYWDMLWERWWLGLPIAIIASVGFGYYQLQPKAPVYVSRVSLDFKVDNPLGGSSNNTVFSLNNHLQKLRSSSFINFVTSFLTEEEKELVQRGYQNKQFNDTPPSVPSLFRNYMNFSPRSNTTILDITVRNQDPEAAKFVANKIAQRYIEYNRELQNAGIHEKIRKLKSLERDWREKVDKLQDELTAYRKEHDISRMDEYQNEAQLRESNINGRIVSIKDELLNLKSQQNNANASKVQGGDLFYISYIASFGKLLSIKESIEEREQARRLMSEKYLERHPSMIENRLILDELSSQYENEIKQALIALENEINDSILLEREYRADLVRVKQQARELDAIQHEYELMERDYEAAYSSYTNIIRQIDLAQIEEKTDPITIAIFEHASQPGEPRLTTIKDVAIQTGALGFALFLVIPIGIGLLDTRIKNSTVIEEKLKLPLLAAIPKMNRLKEDELPFVVSKGLDDQVCESFRGLFSQLHLTTDLKKNPIFLTTSTIPNEGKSLVSTNLAYSFANHEKKVLLIDFDLRRPTLNGFFKEGNSTGILKWLDTDPQNCAGLQENPHLGIVEFSKNLYILKSGGRIKNPTEHFDRLTELGFWDALRENFDITLIDTPPIGIFPDAMLLSEYADETLFVCRFNKVKFGAFRKIIKQFRETIREPLGVIINGLPPSSANAYDYLGYGSYASKYYKNYANK